MRKQTPSSSVARHAEISFDEKIAIVTATSLLAAVLIFYAISVPYFNSPLYTSHISAYTSAIVSVPSAAPTSPDQLRTGMANPAAVYCTEVLGYQYKLLEGTAGQYGVCIMPDGSECEEWAFLKGQCGKKYDYCAKNGYTTLTKSDGKNGLSREYAVCADKMGKELGSVTSLSDIYAKSLGAGCETGSVSVPSSVAGIGEAR